MTASVAVPVLDLSQNAFDPFAITVRLAILPNVLGLKIKIENFQIYPDVPSTIPILGSLFDGARRNVIQKSGAGDFLKIEEHPVIAARWFTPKNNPKIARVFSKAVEGLRILRNTYDHKNFAELTVEKLDKIIEGIETACKRDQEPDTPEPIYHTRIRALWADKMESFLVLFEQLDDAAISEEKSERKDVVEHKERENPSSLKKLPASSPDKLSEELKKIEDFLEKQNLAFQKIVNEEVLNFLKFRPLMPPTP